VAAVGRRVSTLCKGEDGLRQQLAVFHCYDNFCLPHASLRQPLLVPEPTNGRGSVKQWRPCTPAMAAGFTDHVWSLKEVLLDRVPPWPQPQALYGIGENDDRTTVRIRHAQKSTTRAERGPKNLIQESMTL
jgi:hypothetical protein